MKQVNANGKVKVKGCRTPDFNHRHDKIGANIVRQLHRDGKALVYCSPMAKEIVLELVRIGIASKTVIDEKKWLVQRVGKLRHIPRVKVKKKSNWRK